MALTKFKRKKKVAQPEFRFGLGDQVEDRITGYKGVVAARTEWLYGCRRYHLQSREMKDGKPVEALNCDEDALILLEEAGAGKKIGKTGGSQDAPSRAPATPARR